MSSAHVAALPFGLKLVADAARFFISLVASRAALGAENAFLRKQLAMYVERNARPRRSTDGEKLALVILARLFNWREALVIVTPRTFKSWQQAIERSFWQWISRPRAGRPAVPLAVRQLVRRIARENPQWSCGEIARTAAVQLGVGVDEKTVRKYLPLSDPRRRRGRRGDQTWATFVRNHAKAMAACDFVTVMTVQFRILYVVVVMEIGSRRILHVAVTDHPTAGWTSQQLREAIPVDGSVEYLIHDGAGMFNRECRGAVARVGVQPLRTPPYAPQANAYCERLLRTSHRNAAPAMSRLDHSVVRESPSRRDSRMGRTL